VRRKDITQLFLGTGLGTRSYAIIEQGMISRVIEARPDDLRAFLEEAAGISRYKERRAKPRTGSAYARKPGQVNDLREEVEKQIRHLQRQAATARATRSLRKRAQLQAELLACRMQSLDAEAAVRDAGHRAARPRCTPCSPICVKPKRTSSASAPISNRRRMPSARFRPFL